MSTAQGASGNMPNSSKKRKASDYDTNTGTRPRSTPHKEKVKKTKSKAGASPDEIPFTTSCPVQGSQPEGDVFVGTETLTADLTFQYAVRPGEKWQSWKSYKNVKYSEVTFTSGATIYVNKNDPPPKSPPQDADEEELLAYDRNNFWVARIAETRAASDKQVLLRVFWLYWPEELPMGRQPYHSKRELILSNAMDIVDATTISYAADVQSWDETDVSAQPGERFWRQTFDISKLGKDKRGGLSELQKHCVCQQPYDPDTIMFLCRNPACATWNHAKCLEDDSLKIAWAHYTNGTLNELDISMKREEQPQESLGEKLLSPLRDLGKIVQHRIHPAPITLADQPAQPIVNGKSKAVKRGRPRKSGLTNGVDATSWDGILTASILDEEKEEGPVQCLVEEVTKQGTTRSWTLALKCLKCGQEMD